MKKRLLIAVVFLLAIMSLQLAVFADMGAPEIEPYKATVSNVNGAKYYNYENEVVGTLDYGTVITVFYETEDWETKEVTVNFSFTDEQIDLYMANIDDITAILDEGQEIKYSKETEKELVILKEGGIEISKGPAYAYEKTGVTIPKGEKLIGYRGTENRIDVPWYYVTYKGTSGWICELNSAIGFEKNYENQVLLTPRETKIYKSSDSNKVVGTIPANTKITDFLDVDQWSRGYYVTYNGVSGFLSDSFCATNFPWYEEGDGSFEYEVNYPEVKLYKEANTNGEVLIENIPEGTKLKYFYGEDIRFTGWIYTTYNNINGWVFYLEDGTDYSLHLRDANFAVEAQEADENEVEDVVTEEVTGNTVDDIENEEPMTNEVSNNDAQNEENNDSTMISATQIVLLCAMFGVTIAITSIVTIALVNRKKK